MSRPFAALRACGRPAAPTLSLDESHLVRRLRRGERLTIGRDLPLSVAIRLAAIGAIFIRDGVAVAFDPRELPF